VMKAEEQIFAVFCSPGTFVSGASEREGYCKLAIAHEPNRSRDGCCVPTRRRCPPGASAPPAGGGGEALRAMPFIQRARL
jgi:hypothetical protein